MNASLMIVLLLVLTVAGFMGGMVTGYVLMNVGCDVCKSDLAECGREVYELEESAMTYEDLVEMCSRS